MKRTISTFRADWYLVLGILLLLWGAVGTFVAFQDTGSNITGNNDGASSDEGFVPYYVPMRKTSTTQPQKITVTIDSNQAISGTPDAAGIVKTVPGLNTPEPTAIIFIPDRIVIPAIHLDAPVMEAKATKVEIDGSEYIEWLAPDDFAAGWHTDSAPLGEIGNTVLNGHHNVHGKVFENLAYLQQGDIIKMYSGEQEFDYIVTNKMVLPERFATLEKRMENARWIMPSDDERLTLVTCWPKQTNTHRLVIVARPAN